MDISLIWMPNKLYFEWAEFKTARKAGLSNVRPAKHFNVAQELQFQYPRYLLCIENMLKIQKFSNW